jgi:DNA-binding winged helix-turn-helix (wHTH) protein
MSGKSIRYLLFPVAVILAGVLTLRAMWTKQTAGLSERQFGDKVNLAIRQAADRLLDLAGNTTSTIPPVERTASNEYFLRLETTFNYDSLSSILHKALLAHGIEQDYYVAVTDCSDFNHVLLGYTASTLLAGEESPCGGREQPATCYNLRVTFPNQPATVMELKGLWILGTAVFLLLVAIPVFRFLKKKKPVPPLTAENRGLVTNGFHPSENGQEMLRFGNSIFDFSNQLLTTGTVRRELTFREAKLLHLFCRNQNQLLGRDQILKEVWEDEGVLVGRSVDVFVSRLRKLLKEDEQVKIVNIHAVGYRFEVSPLKNDENEIAA